jgi:hypothetical protein
MNPAPNFGFSWNPTVDGGVLDKLLGRNRTVISGSYGISYYNEGLNAISNVMSGNRGTTQSISATAGTHFEPGKLELRSPSPSFTVDPPSFAFPIPMSKYVLAGGTDVSFINPDLKSPYVQNWNFRIQRELVPGLILEARYVGNKSTHVWHYQNVQETNILENGFLAEFQRAQQNLAINQANGRGNNFQNNGLAGQSPLPIFEAAFGANGRNAALAAGSGFASSGFITNLQQGAAGSLANSLALTSSPTYYCRLVGANFAPCAALGYTDTRPYPINFFRPNPFANNLFYQDSNVNTNYHGLQLELRRAWSKGLMFTAGYTWSHALGGISNLDNQTSQDQWQTQRNGRLDYGPLPFDRRHTFFSYWTYDLPIGKNRWINTPNSVLDRIVGGWTLGGIERISTGTPVLLTGGRNTFNQFADGGVVFGNGLTPETLRQRLDTIVSDYTPSCQCFKANVADIIQTNGSPNTAYYGPGQAPGMIGPTIYISGLNQFQLDMSLTKEAAITERLRFKFQSVVFNFLNHPFMGRGNSGATSTTFGNVTTAEGRRTMQLRAYLTW